MNEQETKQFEQLYTLRKEFKKMKDRADNLECAMASITDLIDTRLREINSPVPQLDIRFNYAAEEIKRGVNALYETARHWKVEARSPGGYQE